MLEDSMHVAISKLELPKPGKKVNKLIHRSAKKLALVYAELLKKEEKRRRKAEKLLHKSVYDDGQMEDRKQERMEVTSNLTSLGNT